MVEMMHRMGRMYKKTLSYEKKKDDGKSVRSDKKLERIEKVSCVSYEMGSQSQ